jgi:hypothetical protein
MLDLAHANPREFSLFWRWNKKAINKVNFMYRSSLLLPADVSEIPV